MPSGLKVRAISNDAVVRRMQHWKEVIANFMRTAANTALTDQFAGTWFAVSQGSLDESWWPTSGPDGCM